MGLPVIHFGDFELDAEHAELRRAGQSVELQARPLQILVYLVERRDRFVTKEELFEAVWPGTIVSESALFGAIRALREALDDSGTRQKWIRTQRGRGFRFVGEVEAAGGTPIAPPEPHLAPAPQRPRSRLWLASAGLVLAAAALAAGLFAIRSLRSRPATTSLVVLPFEDLSPGGDHAWLAGGLAEELIDTLAQVPQLEVKARTSGEVARRMGWDVAEIGRRAGVSRVIEGSVRHSDGQLRVAVQLIDARSGFHLWSRTYDRSTGDVLELQQEIASAVAAALEVPLQIRRRPTGSVEAWGAYRMGSALVGQGTHAARLRARGHLEHAIALDPKFAAAHVTLASVEASLCRLDNHDCEAARPRAWRMLERALDLDPELAAAHLVHAELLEDAWDWAGAEKAARRALELGPPGGFSLLLANLLMERGEIDEGLRMLERAQQSWPPTGWNSFPFGLIRVMLGVDLDQALLLLEGAWELSPDLWPAALQRLSVHRLLGRDDLALQALLDTAVLPPPARQDIRNAYATGGWEAVDALLLERVHEGELGPFREPCDGGITGVYVAGIHVRAGDFDGALDCLEQRYRAGQLSLFMHLGVSWLWDPLRDDPRFQTILEGMGLADISAGALARVRSWRDCSGPSPSFIRCTGRGARSVAGSATNSSE